MEMYGNTICVSFTELVGGGIISKPTYDKYTREGRLTVVQRGGNGREERTGGADSLPIHAGTHPCSIR